MENNINFNNQMANPAPLRIPPRQTSKAFSNEELQRNSQYLQSRRDRTLREDWIVNLIHQQNFGQPRIIRVRSNNPIYNSEIVFDRATKRQGIVSPQVIIDTNTLLYVEATINHPNQPLENIPSITTCTPQIDIVHLKAQFFLRGESEILQFIATNQFLLDLLPEAQSNIINYFPGSELALRVITNPEGVDDSQLVLFIITNLTPEDALSMLQQFDDAWWIDALDRTQGKLCITLEFQ
jgi:hypothetical protein